MRLLQFTDVAPDLSVPISVLKSKKATHDYNELWRPKTTQQTEVLSIIWHNQTEQYSWIQRVHNDLDYVNIFKKNRALNVPSKKACMMLASLRMKGGGARPHHAPITSPHPLSASTYRQPISLRFTSTNVVRNLPQRTKALEVCRHL